MPEGLSAHSRMLTAENAVIRKFRIVRQEGSRQVRYAIGQENLDVITAVGYCVKSGGACASADGVPASSASTHSGLKPK